MFLYMSMNVSDAFYRWTIELILIARASFWISNWTIESPRNPRLVFPWNRSCGIRGTCKSWDEKKRKNGSVWWSSIHFTDRLTHSSARSSSRTWSRSSGSERVSREKRLSSPSAIQRGMNGLRIFFHLLPIKQLVGPMWAWTGTPVRPVCNSAHQGKDRKNIGV